MNIVRLFVRKNIAGTNKSITNKNQQILTVDEKQYRSKYAKPIGYIILVGLIIFNILIFFNHMKADLNVKMIFLDFGISPILIRIFFTKK
jgi:hypothetical protein